MNNSYLLVLLSILYEIKYISTSTGTIILLFNAITITAAIPIYI